MNPLLLTDLTSHTIRFHYVCARRGLVAISFTSGLEFKNTSRLHLKRRKKYILRTTCCAHYIMLLLPGWEKRQENCINLMMMAISLYYKPMASFCPIFFIHCLQADHCYFFQLTNYLSYVLSCSCVYIVSNFSLHSHMQCKKVTFPVLSSVHQIHVVC